MLHQYETNYFHICNILSTFALHVLVSKAMIITIFILTNNYRWMKTFNYLISLNSFPTLPLSFRLLFWFLLPTALLFVFVLCQRVRSFSAAAPQHHTGSRIFSNNRRFPWIWCKAEQRYEPSEWYQVAEMGQQMNDSLYLDMLVTRTVQH